jgi:hypothetical protein
MSKSIINLTIPLIVAEIEQVLGTYPHHPYQQVFANPDIRQDLIAYVLTQVHSVYVVVDEGEKGSSDIETISNSAETQASLESFIHQGIYYILHQNPSLANFQIPGEDEGNLAASHWFG